MWRLSGGKVHASDATNASRTLLLDIRKGAWDGELCRILGVPPSMLPEVVDCSGALGVTTADFLGAPVPVLGMAGDQQAATVGQACTKPGMIKATYGTGCFAMLNTGNLAPHSRNRLLTTIAYQLGGKRTYALEGSIFIAGAAVQWLRDGLKLIKQSSEVEPLAMSACSPFSSGRPPALWMPAQLPVWQNSRPKCVPRMPTVAVGVVTPTRSRLRRPIRPVTARIPPLSMENSMLSRSGWLASYW